MEIKQIWEEALKIIEQEVTTAVSFDTWIVPIVPCGIDDNKFILQVEDIVAKETIEFRMMNIIRNAVKYASKKEYEIVLIIPEERNRFPFRA